jgi:hypothetical protein
VGSRTVAMRSMISGMAGGMGRFRQHDRNKPASRDCSTGRAALHRSRSLLQAPDISLRIAAYGILPVTSLDQCSPSSRDRAQDIWLKGMRDLRPGVASCCLVVARIGSATIRRSGCGPC